MLLRDDERDGPRVGLSVPGVPHPPQAALELVAAEERIAVSDLRPELRLDGIQLEAFVAEDGPAVDAVEARRAHPHREVVQRGHLRGLGARERREEAKRDAGRRVVGEDGTNDERARRRRTRNASSTARAGSST
jgi:hypothetical protein